MEVINHLKNVGTMLSSFKTRNQKIKEYSQSLSAKVANGMSSELDNEVKNFIVNIAKTKKDFNEQRSPFTKKLNEIIKQFVAQEKEIDVISKEMQVHRDAWAKAVAIEAQKAEREARQKQLKADELIHLNSQYKIDITAYTEQKIAAFKKSMVQALHTVTPENAEIKTKGLQALTTDLPDKFLGDFKTLIASKYGNDSAAIKLEICLAEKENIQRRWHEEISIIKGECIYHIKHMLESDEAEKKAALAAKMDEIESEKDSKMEITKMQVESNAQAAKAENAFDSISNYDQETPEARKGYEIKILNKSAYPALVAYWFATIGKTFDESKFEKKTIGSMIKDLQNHAHKTGEKLENTSIKYEVTYKAINRAS